MLEVRFSDGSTGELELTDGEYAVLLDFARKGVRIMVPVGTNGVLFYINIIDIRKVIRPEDENIDYMQLAALGSKTTFSR